MIEFTYTPNQAPGKLQDNVRVATASGTELVGLAFNSQIKTASSIQAIYVPNQASAPEWTGRHFVSSVTPLYICYAYKNPSSGFKTLTFSRTTDAVVTETTVNNCPIAVNRLPPCSVTTELAAGKSCVRAYQYQPTQPSSSIINFKVSIDDASQVITHPLTLLRLPDDNIMPVSVHSSNLPTVNLYQTAVNAPTQIKVAILNGASKAVTLMQVNAVIAAGDAAISMISDATDDCVVGKTLNANQECFVRAIITPKSVGKVSMQVSLQDSDTDKAEWQGSLQAVSGTTKQSTVYANNYFNNDMAAVGDNVYLASGNGLSISRDGGVTWAQSNPLSGNWVRSIEFVDEGSSKTLYVGTASGLSIGIDNGTTITWMQNITKENNGIASDYINYIYVVDKTPRHIYLATDGGLSISVDGGTTWKNYTLPNTDYDSQYLTNVYVSGNTIYVGTHGSGLYISHDNGVSWNKHIMPQPPYDWGWYPENYIMTLYVDGDTIYAGTMAGLYVSEDDGAHWRNHSVEDGLYSPFIWGITKVGNTVYLSNYKALAVSPDNGFTWTQYTSDTFFPERVKDAFSGGIAVEGSRVYLPSMADGLFTLDLGATTS